MNLFIFEQVHNKRKRYCIDNSLREENNDLTLSMLGIFYAFVGVCCVSFFFSKKSFKKNIRLSNGSDPNQDRRSVSPDLCSN